VGKIGYNGVVSRQIIFRIHNEQLSFEKQLLVSDGQTIRVGRVEENEISVNDPKISRHHAQIEFHKDSVLVRDLNSRHGTFLNGERMNHSFHLRSGDAIKIGDTEIRYRFEDQTSKSVQESKSNLPQSHYQWYLQKDLSSYLKNSPQEPSEELDTFYRKMLLFPFFLLFVFFALFPSATTFLVSLTYSGIALYFSKNLLTGPGIKNHESFQLPITRRINKLQAQIQKKVNSLPSFDRNLLGKMQKEMLQFVEEKLPQMEKDIFSLNRSLVSGTLQRLEQRKNMLESELKNAGDESISLQIQNNLSRLNRQIKMQKNIKNILMHLILKLEDYQIQLEILESTLIAQEFRDNYTDFSNRFLDLQEDIDEVYREYNALKVEEPFLLTEEKPAGEIAAPEKPEALVEKPGS